LCSPSVFGLECREDGAPVSAREPRDRNSRVHACTGEASAPAMTSGPVEGVARSIPSHGLATPSRIKFVPLLPAQCSTQLDHGASNGPLCCFGSLLRLAFTLRLRLRFRLLLRGPPLAHPFGGGFPLRGRELAIPLLRRCGAGGGRGQGCRILRWPTSSLHWSLKSFDGSVQLVSFCNQKSYDLFGRHDGDPSILASVLLFGIYLLLNA
jgi:hypothetical protein